MTPLFEQEGFIICFTAEEEEINMRHHFITECGWTAKQYRRIKNFLWFCAKVSAWKDGKELGSSYLGCCSYKTIEAFYTTYRNDYFADMVKESIDEAKRSIVPQGV